MVSATATPDATMVPAWLVPTARACQPALLAVAGVAALYTVAVVVAGAFDAALPVVHVWLALGALAGAAAWSHDPAASLLAALPVGPGRRLLRRVGLGTVTAVVAWTVAGQVGGTVAAAPPGVGLTESVPALLALVALAVTAGRWFGTWGGLTPLALVAAGRFVAESGRLADALALWWTHPWIVLALALSTLPAASMSRSVRVSGLSAT